MSTIQKNHHEKIITAIVIVTYNNTVEPVLFSPFEMRHRKIKQLAVGHTARKGLSQDLNPVQL